MFKKVLFSFVFSFFLINCAFSINDYIREAEIFIDNDISEAIYYYKKSIEEYPKDTDGYVGLAKIRLKQKKFTKALNNLLVAKDIDENNFEVNYNLGEYHFKRKNFNKAAEYYQKAQDLKKSKDDNLFIKMGKTYEKLGDIPKARTSYINALTINTKNIPALNSLKRLDKLVGKQEHRY